MQSRTDTAVGLAIKSGRFSKGTDAVVGAIRKRDAKFVIIFESASSNTKKLITDKCKYYNIEYSIVNDDCLKIGFDVKVISINDENIAKIAASSEGDLRG